MIPLALLALVLAAFALGLLIGGGRAYDRGYTDGCEYISRVAESADMEMVSRTRSMAIARHVERTLPRVRA